MASAGLPDGLIDTDILIDAERGHPNAIAFVSAQKAGGGPRLSIVSAMELLVGCRNATEMKHVRQFLGQVLVLPLDAAISQRAMTLIESYSLSHGLLIPDGLIAATALEHALPLFSKNMKHFQMIQGLTVSRPYP